MKSGLTKKKLIVIISICVVLLIGIAVGVILFFTGGENKSYRIIRIYDIQSGTALVNRPKIGDLNAYIDMRLQSSDTLFTSGDCYLQLQMDEDKYCLVEPNTTIQMIYEGDENTNRTIIVLIEGSVITQIEGKLSDGSDFRITTSNSTIAVRGTCFRVAVSSNGDQSLETAVQVLDGTVEFHAVDENGVEAEEAIFVPAGYATVVETAVDPVTKEKKTEVTAKNTEVVYEELDTTAIDFIKECNDNEDTKIEIFWRVEFRYNDQLFGTQKIADGGLATVPSLKPAPTGHWDFDFSQSITGKTVIHWVED